MYQLITFNIFLLTLNLMGLFLIYLFIEIDSQYLKERHKTLLKHIEKRHLFRVKFHKGLISSTMMWRDTERLLNLFHMGDKYKDQTLKPTKICLLKRLIRRWSK